MTINLEDLAAFMKEDLPVYLIKIIGCLIVLFLGFKIINGIVRRVQKMMLKTRMEKTLAPFLSSLLGWGLRLVLVFGIIAFLGFDLTTLAAIFAAMAFAVGMALQGTLANFAGGVLLLIFRPYKIGDLVEVLGGKLGTVKEIQIFNTFLLSPENKTIIVPNGAVMNGEIVNYTVEGKIRVDTNIGIAYNSDIGKAREVLMSVMSNHEKVLPDPKPLVAVSELADSAINLAVRPWCKPECYWDVYFETLELGKEALDKAGIEIPFPQIDLNLDADSISNSNIISN